MNKMDIMKFWIVAILKIITFSTSNEKIWDEQQSADVSKIRDLYEGHKSYALKAQSRFSDRPRSVKL